MSHIILHIENALDHIVKDEKDKAKVIRPGKEFSRYIKKIAK